MSKLQDESSADHLVDRRLHECRANRFPLASTLAEVRDELAVIADVCSKAIEAVDDLLRSVRTGLFDVHKHPAFYNELTSNCTTNVRVHTAATATGKPPPWDWRPLINGIQIKCCTNAAI